MKTLMLRAITTLCFGAVLVPAYLRAESMQANIPFDFTVGKTTLKAGDYTVDHDIGPAVLRIRSADYKSAVVVLTNSLQTAKANGKGTLVFNRYGSHYFLSRVWEGSGAGRELPRSKAEQEMIAAAPAQPVTLTASK